MRMAFFEFLSRLDMQKKHLTVTVVSGPEAGEKAVLSEDTCVYCSKDGLLASHLPQLRSLEGIGLTTINGQEVFYEQLQGRPKLVICGGGHVGLALTRLCAFLKYEVTVIEDRPHFAEEAKKAGAEHVICDDFAHALRAFQSDRGTCFVVMTRGHRYDMDCLRQILSKPRSYVGLMASKSRTDMISQTLRSEGFSEDAVKGICMPVGLAIGSETPEEIAVSVAAQIIQTLSAGKRRSQLPREILKMVSGGAAGSPFVLATIIRRTGSGPRNAGTKMLISADGQTAGTIGGGCSEAEVLRIACQMLSDGECCRRHVINLRPADISEEDGMACGGQIEIFLEVVV